jgi:hypothetical protein
MVNKTYTPEDYRRDQSIVRYAIHNDLDFDDSYADVDDKIKLLRDIVGIRNLRVASNDSNSPFMPIEECEDARISMVALRYFQEASKRLDEYEYGERVMVNPSDEVSSRKPKINLLERTLPLQSQPDLFPESFDATNELGLNYGRKSRKR